MIDECEHQGRGTMPPIHDRRPLGRESDPVRGRRGRGEYLRSNKIRPVVLDIGYASVSLYVPTGAVDATIFSSWQSLLGMGIHS